jgi:glutamyl-tRNA synthetase
VRTARTTSHGREAIYHSYVRELLRTGQAYLCFATREDLAQITARQEAAKVPTGYYGEWAIWRDADPADVRRRLDEGCRTSSGSAHRENPAG